jgi:hypothetical protein
MSGEAGCSVKGEIMMCGNGFVLNSTNGDAEVQMQDRIGKPVSMVYVNADDKFVERRFNDSNVDVSVALIPSSNGFQTILMSPELAKSMFTRLYFFRGHDLRHFDLFNNQHQLTGGEIYVWKVDWNGHAPNQVFTKPTAQNPQESNKGNVTESNTTLSNTTPESEVQKPKEAVSENLSEGNTTVSNDSLHASIVEGLQDNATNAS